MSQIADGENGGVMMNEFPEAFLQANERIRDGGGGCVAINGGEYLELLGPAASRPPTGPGFRAAQQQRLWDAVVGPLSPQTVQRAIDELQRQGDGFHMDGASWTNDLSWVKGYDNVLEPMLQLSANFHRRWDRAVLADAATTNDPDYRACLLYLLLSETSCFRTGAGRWTEYAQTLVQRGSFVTGRCQSLAQNERTTLNKSVRARIDDIRTGYCRLPRAHPRQGQIETMLLDLAKLELGDLILQQLRQVHQQLETLHDLRRAS